MFREEAVSTDHNENALGGAFHEVPDIRSARDAAPGSSPFAIEPEHPLSSPVTALHEPGGRAVTDDPNPDEVPADAPGAGENICRACGGSGKVEGKTCAECEGSGKVTTGIGGG